MLNDNVQYFSIKSYVLITIRIASATGDDEGKSTLLAGLLLNVYKLRRYSRKVKTLDQQINALMEINPLNLAANSSMALEFYSRLF